MPEPEVVPRRTKQPTPEQLERRKEVDERCQRLQEKGVPAPKSGTFGGKGKGE